VAEADGVGLTTAAGSPDLVACGGSRGGSGDAHDVDGELCALLDGLGDGLGDGVGLLEGLGEECVVVRVAVPLGACVGLLVGVGEGLGFGACLCFFCTTGAVASGSRNTSDTHTTPFLTTTPIPSWV
jgi:hypothetical protein